MAKTKNEIIKEIEDHFKGKAYNGCYVGITSDVTNRLFGDHKVSKETDHWIYRTTSSHNVAREIEKLFLETGMDGGGGGGGGGDETSKIVYVYKKTSSTKP